ncbi:MAG: hypothetical protein IT542_07560 [Rubellimicrobium sp.]|nr:hypothetical protein [Rubellimicrobium sp.]
MTGPVEPGQPWKAYLDQNVLSRLREYEPGSDLLRGALNKMGAQGVMFVYSMVNVDESRASGRPEAFVEALNAISAWYIEPQAHDDHRVVLSSGRAEELTLADRDLLHEAARTMENLLKPMQFAMGWLDGVDETSLREELVEGVNEFWGSLERELPEENRVQLTGGKRAMLDSISDIPLGKVRGEAEVWFDRIRARLPENYAQLVAIPADQLVEFVLGLLDAPDRDELPKLYPRGFWTDALSREEGNLAGFAFMLFALGIVRDKRVSSKDRARREKHFLGQFRDCQHIEAASRCAAFITLDKGAARLAQATYAYAGVATEVIRLEIRET